MENLVQYLIRILVDEPDQVQVTCRQSGGSAVYLVQVAPGDVGKVIGRQGRTANSLRHLVEAAGQCQGVRATLDIVS